MLNTLLPPLLLGQDLGEKGHPGDSAGGGRALCSLLTAAPQSQLTLQISWPLYLPTPSPQPQILCPLPHPRRLSVSTATSSQMLCGASPQGRGVFLLASRWVLGECASARTRLNTGPDAVTRRACITLYTQACISFCKGQRS